MFDDDKGLSPIEAAIKLTPWWMQRMRDFNSLEIRPCIPIGNTPSGRKILGTCDPREAACWAVRGHYCPNGVDNGFEDLMDFPTQFEAHKFYERLLTTWPHLGTNRHNPKAQSHKQFTP